METATEKSVGGQAIVQVLAAVLDRLVGANHAIARTDPGQVTKFHATKAPGISILQYLERIRKYASCSNECFVLALIYIDRLIQRNNFLLTDLNVHRVVVTAILLAAKFFDDAYYNNAYYAKVGGVLVSEMNGLEVDFLFRINFSLHVTPEVFDKYRAELMVHSTTANNNTSATAMNMPQTIETQRSLPEDPQLPILPTLMTVPDTSDDPMCTVRITPPPPSDEGDSASSQVDLTASGASGVSLNHTIYAPSTAAPSIPTEFVGPSNNDTFIPMQRANSMPVDTNPVNCASNPVLLRRRQSNKSFSAPPIVTPQAPLFPALPSENSSFMAIDHQIFPVRGTSVNHHVGGFVVPCGPESKAASGLGRLAYDHTLPRDAHRLLMAGQMLAEEAKM